MVASWVAFKIFLCIFQYEPWIQTFTITCASVLAPSPHSSYLLAPTTRGSSPGLIVTISLIRWTRFSVCTCLSQGLPAAGHSVPGVAGPPPVEWVRSPLTWTGSVYHLPEITFPLAACHLKPCLLWNNTHTCSFKKCATHSILISLFILSSSH